MEIKSITDKPLITITTWSGEKYYLEKTIEDYDSNKPKDKQSLRDFIVTDGTRVRFSDVRKSRVASELDYFWHYIVPKIEPHIVSQMTQSINSLTENQKNNLKIQQILGYIERKREDEKYYSM